MGEVHGTNGFAIAYGDKHKLEKLCRELGADIHDGQKFKTLPVGNVARLPDLNELKAAAIEGLRLTSIPPSMTEAVTVTAVGAAPPTSQAPPVTVEAVSVHVVAPEVVAAERVELEYAVSTSAERREARLTDRFREYLETSHGHEVKRYKISTPAGVFYTDIADITAGILYEAKGSSDRMSIRLALGQILDYGRYVDDDALAVLLPDRPADDLIELLESHEIGCVIENDDGTFSDLTGRRRCP